MLERGTLLDEAAGYPILSGVGRNGSCRSEPPSPPGAVRSVRATLANRRSADRAHPLLSYRSGRGGAPGPTARGGSPTPTTRRRAARSRSSRTSSATRCCRSTPTRTRRPREPASRRPRSGRTRGDHSRRASAPDEHAVIFCGSGSTGAIDRLIGVLNLRHPADLDDRYALSEQIPPEERPVVFIGPYEHHSNELAVAGVHRRRRRHRRGCRRPHRPRAAGARSCTHQHRPLKIGSFSAASNVTGIISDSDGGSSCCTAGALSFWDFAAAAPLRRHRDGPGAATASLAYKDASSSRPTS